MNSSKKPLWRYIGETMAWFLVVRLVADIIMYYFDGEIRFSWFGIVFYFVASILMGYFLWRRESAKKEAPPV